MSGKGLIEDALQTLFEIGTLSARDAIDHSIVALSTGGRNDNVLVSAGPNSWLLKRPKIRFGEDERLLANEWQALTFIRQSSCDANWIPSLIGENFRGVLTHTNVACKDLANFRTGETYSVWFDRSERHAAILKKLHSLRPVVGQFETGRPWALGLNAPSVELFRRSREVNKRLIEIVQNSKEISRGLQAANESWVADSFGHGDTRWENWLVSDERTDFLIDWETAGFIDHRWDLAGYLSEVIRRWAESEDAASRDEWLQIARHSASGLASGYEIDRDVLLSSTVMSLCATWLLQRAYEKTHGFGRITEKALILLQLAENIFSRKEQFVADLFH